MIKKSGDFNVVLQRIVFAAFLMSFGSSFDAIAEPVITVGIYDNPPIDIISKEGQPAGVYVDLVNAMAKEEGWKVKYVFGSWSDLLQKTIDNKLDLLTAIAATPQRRKVLDFSDPVLSEWGTVYVGHKSPIVSISNLKGKRIGVLKNDIHGKNFKHYAKKFGLHAQYQNFLSWKDAFNALDQNKVDAVIVNSVYGFYAANQYPIHEIGIQFSPIKIRFAVAKNTHLQLLKTINEKLRVWREDPSSPYQKSLKKWLSLSANESVWPLWLLPMIYITAVALLIGLLFIFLLRRMVHTKSEEYLEEVESRLQGERALFQLREQMESFTSAMPDPGFILSREGYFRAVYCDDRSKLVMPGIMDLSPKAMQKVNLDDVIADKPLVHLMMETIRATLESGELQEISYPLWIVDHEAIMEARVSRLDQNNVVWLHRDVTKRIAMEGQLTRMSLYDPTTGLANRKLLLDRLQGTLATARREGHLAALVFLDIDEFKQINDQHGHEKGDQVLKSVALFLQTKICETDTVSRLGGDEFALILNFLESEEEVLDLVVQLTSQVEFCGRSQGIDFPIKVSIGVAFWHSGMTQALWMKHADLALSEAKRQGKNGYYFFSTNLNERFDEETFLFEKLRDAVENRHFYMVYQPQFSTDKKYLVGLEALIRWQDGNTLISPAQFIPVAERHGLISEITWLTLKWVCEDINQWQVDGVCPPKVAVNLSPEVMKTKGWELTILDVIKSSGVPAEKIEIEITENSLVEDFEENLRAINVLRRIGVHFSIDDFGTGYSSMQYLEKLPVNKLKIDQGFVRNMEGNATNLAIIRSIITLAHSLDMIAIAEGVETNEQLNQLKAYGCNEIQGFLFSKPLSHRDIDVLLGKFMPLQALYQQG